MNYDVHGQKCMMSLNKVIMHSWASYDNPKHYLHIGLDGVIFGNLQRTEPIHTHSRSIYRCYKQPIGRQLRSESV